MTMTRTPRPNRYPGNCGTCGKPVAAEAGYLTGTRGAWGVRHRTADDCTAAAPAETRTTTTTVTTTTHEVADGEFHVVGDTLYRVQKARGSDRLYAKAATIACGHCGARLTVETIDTCCAGEHGVRVVIDWEYVGRRPFAQFTDDTVMTWEQARHLGTLTSKCIRCSTTLGGDTNESEIRSLAAGYGRTCAENMGWPYPTLAEATKIIASRTRRVAA